MVYQNCCNLSGTSVLVCYSSRSVPKVPCKTVSRRLTLRHSRLSESNAGFWADGAFSRATPKKTSAKWPPQSKSKQLHGKPWMRSFLVNDAFVDCERVPPYIIMFLSEGQHNINTINHAAVMNQPQSPLLYGYLLAEAFFQINHCIRQEGHLGYISDTAVGTLQYNGYCNPTAHRCR